MSDDTSAYPPYLTDQGMRCLTLYELSKRWRRREPMWTPYILLGNAVAAGLEAFLKHEGDPYEIAEDVVRQGFPEGETEWGVDGLVKHARNGVMAGSQTDFGCPQTLGVERQYDRCRPDFVGRKHNGRIRIVDHKVKLSIDSKYVGSELKKYETSNQFYMYAWRIGQFYQEMVEDVCVHLIILGPRPKALALHPALKPTEEKLAWWLKGAERAWQEMDAVDRGELEPGPRLSNCTDRWGPCPMYDLCHNMDGDEALAHAVYDRVLRRDER